jgi:putative ABC transport system permease protein
LGWPIRVSSGAVGVAVLASATVGLFFGLYPARKAAGLDPIAALHHE